MKLEETENLKLHYENNIEKTSQNKNLQDSDNDFTQTITQKLNTYETNPNFKGSHHSKDGAPSVVDMDTALLNADKNNRTTRLNHNSTEN